MSQNIPDFTTPEFGGRNPRIALVTALWNGAVTDELLAGAIARLHECGVHDADICSVRVPGAVELTYAAARLMDKADAVIVFGCVLRGETPHFDYVCRSVTDGVTRLNSRGTTPVIFGLLTVDTMQQALDRIGGPAGHKGREAADTALQMVAFSRRF